MSTTSNVIAGVTLGAALVGGALLIDPEPGTVAPDGGVVDAGQQPLIGNFYLRFDSEQAFERALRGTPFWRQDTAIVDAGMDDAGVHRTETVTLDSGVLVPATMDYSFDIIGTITRPIPDAGPDAGVQVLEGWHVNFSGILPPAWAQYIVQPENPVRAMR